MKIDKYYNIVRLKKISAIIISFTAILSILIILFSIYGNQVGNFVIAIEEKNRYTIALSEDKSFKKSFTRLSADGLKKMVEATYDDIPEDITETDGSHNDTVKLEYLAYTFYLKNTSNTAIEYSTKLLLEKVTKNVDSAIRIMIIRNNEEPVIYAKWREAPESEDVWGLPEEHLGDYDYFGHTVRKKYSTTKFESSVTVFNTIRRDFAADAIDKYTVVMWLEGMDAQCTNNEIADVMGGTLKLEMEFTVLN